MAQKSVTVNNGAEGVPFMEILNEDSIFKPFKFMLSSSFSSNHHLAFQTCSIIVGYAQPENVLMAANCKI